MLAEIKELYEKIILSKDEEIAFLQNLTKELINRNCRL